MKKPHSAERPIPAAAGVRPRPVMIVPVILGLLFLPALSSWQAEFRIHTYVINDQTSPAVATDGSGRFFAVWVSERQDGELTGIFGRLFSSYGVPQGPEFQINDNWEHIQERPFVAAGPNGRYVVVWFNYGWEDIGARLFDNSGLPLTNEFIVTEQARGLKGGPAAAMDWNGGFVVVWHAYAFDSGLAHVFARLFDSFGNPLGPQFQVSRDASGDQMNPAVAMHRDGHFTVIWTRFPADGIGSNIVGRRFSRTGLPLDNEFTVNSSTFGRHDRARLVMDSSGAFIACWHAHTYTENAYNILARRFSPMALPLGTEFVVNTQQSGWQVFPSIAGGIAGYLITWQSLAPDENGSGIRAAVLDRNGLPRLAEFRVNSAARSRPEKPAGVFLSFDRIAVLWQDVLDESTGWDVYAAVSDIALNAPDAAKPAERHRKPPLKDK